MSSAKKKKPGHKAVYVLLIVVLLLLLAAGTVVGVFYHYYSLMDVGDTNEDDYSHVVSITDDELTDLSGANVELPEEDVYSDSNVMNILLIGTDERTEKFDPYARADSIMVLSFDGRTKRMKLVSLERGMLVSIPDFNLDAERYIRVNFSVFETLVDQVGGVDVSLSAEEAEALNKLLKKEITAGVNHLDGYSALHYARLRSIDSDWHRIQRQRNVIASIKSGMKDQSVGELNQLATTCLPYVQTNLTSTEFADLLIHLPQYANGDFSQMTVPQKGTFKGLGNVDFEANSKILRQFIYDD